MRAYYIKIIFVLLMFASVDLDAAPRRYSYEEENYQLLRELRDGLDDLRHEINNHEAEIRMLEEKYVTQETIVDSLKQQQVDAQKANKDLLKGNALNLESKITSFESTIKGVVSDLKQLKDYTSTSSPKSKIAELEKAIEIQNQNIEHLQAALTTIMQVLQVEKPLAVVTATKEVATTEAAGSYKVKPGDSLDKIAKNNKTTVNAIKELNGLTRDKIVVGQTLKLP